VGKRTIDLLGAAVLLVVASPVILAAALVSVVAYRRWPFFTQVRVGRDEQPFRLVKVRTLAPDTPASLPKAELEAHRPGAACRFLRAHHIDELPQLAHVVWGTMSLVGPRPEMPSLHALLPDEFARIRTRVRPGITGPWQVSQAVEGMIADHPEYDEWYVAHADLRVDLWILWRTFTCFLGRARLTSLADLPRRAEGADAPVDGVPV
jgi:lipopolysaccharide/colanic/teichoic acid biosynthesis glycosyltransferase